MNGMEILLARMIGRTPEELKTISDKVVSTIENAGNQLVEIHAMQKMILSKLEDLENATRNGTQRRITNNRSNGADTEGRINAGTEQ